MLPRATLFQENSIYQISFNQKFGKPELTEASRTKLLWEIVMAIFRNQEGNWVTQK